MQAVVEFAGPATAELEVAELVEHRHDGLGDQRGVIAGAIALGLSTSDRSR